MKQGSHTHKHKEITNDLNYDMAHMLTALLVSALFQSINSSPQNFSLQLLF